MLAIDIKCNFIVLNKLIMKTQINWIVTNYPALKAALQMPLSRSVVKFGRQMPPKGRFRILLNKPKKQLN